MDKTQRRVILVLGLLSLAAFLLFSIPNSKASDNLAMVTMFEPDEAVMLPVIQRMIGPYPDLLHMVYRFIAYSFYSYGFPHFAPSALVYKALSLFGQETNMPLLMLALRQIITVIPMLASLWLLVYMQDQFKTWRSAALFGFMLLVPAVVQNGFWWHPDGQVMLYSSLVLFFLWKDQLQFGRYYYIAAAICGVLVAIKVVGFFFFLTIGTVLVLGLASKKLNPRQFFAKAGVFILIMAAAILVASPHLLIPKHRAFAFTILKREIFETSKGYGVLYEKGLAAAWPTIRDYYGEALFLLITLGLSVWGLWKRENRLLRVLILTWFIPLSTHLLFFSHFKYQYWLPVALPLFSNLILLLPATREEWRQKNFFSYLRPVLLLIVLIQLVFFGINSARRFDYRVHRAENNPAINFYEKSLAVLEPVIGDMKIYYDYRLYMPNRDRWSIENSFDLLTYDYIESGNFDLLFLSHQRIRDYLQPSIQGIDPENLIQAQVFYRDADAGQITGYKLLLRDGTGLLFIRDDVCLEFYSEEICQ